MNILNFVREELEQREEGSILTYKDFDVPLESIPTLIKALSTFYRQGVLQRIGKGIYYKPEDTEFGRLLPSMTVLLQKLLDEQKDQVSYFTGTNTYNALGLTTQMAMEYVIATDRPRAPLVVGKTTIRFVPARLKQAPSNELLAQLLDAMMDIKVIPDAEPTRTAMTLVALIRQLPAAQRQELADLARAYPPSTRALLGLLFEQMQEPALAQQISQTLNPVSKFRLYLDPSRFPTTSHWNIA